jgi:hypothetical protein
MRRPGAHALDAGMEDPERRWLFQVLDNGILSLRHFLLDI